MVPSSTLAFSVDGECSTCGGISLGKTVRLGSFEFIVNYFSGRSQSPRRGNSCTTIMGSTHNGLPSPRRSMIEDYTEELDTASSGGGGSGLPSPKRLGAGAPPAPITTLP
jgi:hypothetical protein